MAYIQVEGGGRLCGSVSVQGSKNAVLPVLSAAMLHEGTTVFTNVPEISDVADTLELMRQAGCRVRRQGGRVEVDATQLSGYVLPHGMVGRLRSSFLLAGPLLSRMGRIDTFYPGGCSIGARPIDLHLKGFERLGARTLVQADRIYLEAPQGGTSSLRGATVTLPYPSVGATENLILAAVRSEGVTEIKGAAKEPEIMALCRCLNGMGARVEQAGDRIRVTGVEGLHDSVFCIPGDRIVAGTYLAAAGCCGGEVGIEQVDPAELAAVIEAGRQAGMEIEAGAGRLTVRVEDRLQGGLHVRTGPYPQFPTDLQAVFMVMLTQARQASTVQETVFESRFRHVGELRKLNAGVRTEGDVAHIEGNSRLFGNLVQATDLRAGAALVLAGLAAEGVTVVTQAEYILRGYENFAENLQRLGGRVRCL